MTLVPGRFYISRAGDTWCCYRHRPDEAEHGRADCVNVETGASDYFFEDGRYDFKGRSDKCLVSEHPYRPEEI